MDDIKAMIAEKAGNGILASDVHIAQCTNTNSFLLDVSIQVSSGSEANTVSLAINTNLLGSSALLFNALSSSAGFNDLDPSGTVVNAQATAANIPAPSPPPTGSSGDGSGDGSGGSSGSGSSGSTSGSASTSTISTITQQIISQVLPQSFTSTSARKDPHLHFADGGRADFRGEHNKIFNFLSARNVSLNVKTVASDFEWTSGKIVDGKASEGTRLIHGTKMEAAYFHIRTIAPGYLHGRRLLLTYRASAPTSALLETTDFTDSKRAACQLHFLRAARACRQKLTTWTTLALEPSDEIDFDNVHVSLSADAKKLVVTVRDRWELSASVAAFPFAALNKGKRLLDIDARALYDADRDKVAPHGLFGQSFDGDDIEVSGKTDSRGGDETTTTAQAEGAIEGSWRDYMINCDPATKPAGAHCEHSIEWKYSRFDKTEAKPRDVSKLAGKKRKRGANAATARMSGARALPDGWTDVG